MHDQRDVTDLGGTMRLGVYPCKVQPGHEGRGRRTASRSSTSATATAGRSTTATGRAVGAPAWSSPALSPDDRLVEMIELADHPWFVATQAHPEFRSRPNRPQPLFRDFVGAACDRMLAQAGRLPEPAVARLGA